jgi:hypothetical protein
MKLVSGLEYFSIEWIALIFFLAEDTLRSAEYLIVNDIFLRIAKTLALTHH